MYQSLSYQVTRFRGLSLAVGQRPKISVRKHRGISAAIISGRGEAAERLMRAHIEGARAILRQRMTSKPGRARPGNSATGQSKPRRQG